MCFFIGYLRCRSITQVITGYGPRRTPNSAVSHVTHFNESGFRTLQLGVSGQALYHDGYRYDVLSLDIALFAKITAKKVKYLRRIWETVIKFYLVKIMFE